MLNKDEQKHRDIVVKVLMANMYSRTQAVAIATDQILKLRKGGVGVG